MRIGCLIQARLASTRLPRKVLADIGGWPMIKHVVKRCLTAMPMVAVGCPVDDAQDISKALGEAEVCTSPHVDDVLRRYLEITQYYGWDAVVRVTGDCPLIDPFVIKDLVEIFRSGHYDYVANDIIKTYPDGLGVEVISLKALKWADCYAGPTMREHVSTWILAQKMFDKRNHICPFPEIKGLKFSVDTEADLERVRKIDEAKPADYSLDATMAAYRRAYEEA